MNNEQLQLIINAAAKSGESLKWIILLFYVKEILVDLILSGTVFGVIYMLFSGLRKIIFQLREENYISRIARVLRLWSLVNNSDHQENLLDYIEKNSEPIWDSVLRHKEKKDGEVL